MVAVGVGGVITPLDPSRRKASEVKMQGLGHLPSSSYNEDDRELGDMAGASEGTHSRLRKRELEHLLPPIPESFDFDSWDSRVNMVRAAFCEC